MTFEEYQKKAIATSINYGSDLEALIARTLGLAGESGEVAEKVKKLIRDENGDLDKIDKLAMQKELGDVLWYVSSIADIFNINLEEVARGNIEKLADRVNRGKVQGSGDDR